MIKVIENNCQALEYKGLCPYRFTEAIHKAMREVLSWNYPAEDIKVLISCLNIKRIIAAMRSSVARDAYHSGSFHIQGVVFPVGGNYPYNDKIILYIDSSCYNGLAVEIDIKDLEI